MTRNSIDNPTETAVLSLEGRTKQTPGFAKSDAAAERVVNHATAKLIASGFLKFSQDAKSLSETDSVQSFITLAELFQNLTEDAMNYLAQEMPLVYESHPIQPLLLGFAAYRLNQASRAYYFAHLQGQTPEALAAMKAGIQALQQEYDEILNQS